uniref:Protein S100 n=1 Tax=Junco hyemalis TaxID=40217 RepID=A0A8C5IW14_JUNHY
MQGTMAECTELEWAVQVLVNNFDKYSSRCCCCKNPRRISKKDFRKMLSRELNHMLTDTGNRRAADKLICDLDENKDGRISFEEYWTLIGGIASPIAQIIRQQEQGVVFCWVFRGYLLFIAAIKFGGAAGDAQILLGRGIWEGSLP